MKAQLLASLTLLAVYYFAPDVDAQEFTSSLSGDELLDRCQRATEILNEETRHSSLDEFAQAAYCAGVVEAAADAGSFLAMLELAVPQSDGAQSRQSIRNCAA